MNGLPDVYGELRAVSQLFSRLNEASKIGFRKALIPKLRLKLEYIPQALQLIECRSIVDALRLVLPEK